MYAHRMSTESDGRRVGREALKKVYAADVSCVAGVLFSADNKAEEVAQTLRELTSEKVRHVQHCVICAENHQVV